MLEKQLNAADYILLCEENQTHSLNLHVICPLFAIFLNQPQILQPISKIAS